MIAEVKKFIAGELEGWQKGELIWFTFCITAAVAISIYLRDNLAGIIAAASGICYTLLAGKGKISCYAFGIINTILYGWISLKTQLFGEVMLNWGWYLPMMFSGFFFWKRNLGKSNIIRKTTLTWRGRMVCFLASLTGIIIYGFILKKMGDTQPFTDSTTTILSVAAMILTVKRCSDQWLLWTIVNIISVFMWLNVFKIDGKSAAMLIMWMLNFANGIIFYFQWRKDIRNAG